MSALSCRDRSIDHTRGEEIATQTLKELAASGSLPGIDLAALPPPSVEPHNSDLLIDYKDIRQNVWIVVMVHPDGSAEVSYTRIVEENPRPEQDR